MSEKFFDKYNLIIGEGRETPFMKKYGIHQDGTTPMCRDTDGTLWAMSGHAHGGHISVFSGTCLDDMVERWPIELNFSLGHADYAFSGIRYPEGIPARGSIWPFGLYICPGTHRFFCWFHNETGWAGRGTAYDAYGPCQTPKHDTDFRHVGLMHSDDEGQTWIFDRWVLTGHEVAFTERYNPGAGNALGQTGDLIRFGCGDFTLFTTPEDEFLYLFYNNMAISLDGKDMLDAWKSCDAYVARCRKRSDGTMGDFVKFYDGAFCEAGNMGKESPVVRDMWHARVVWCEPLGCYLMTGKPIIKAWKGEIEGVDWPHYVMAIATSDDLVHWSEPEVVYKDGKPFGNHYNALFPDDRVSAPNVLPTLEFSILNNHNGTDVTRYPARIVKKES
ncbi:MAG: hypothetical protein IKB28_04145 [Clostridia bacterium]|nr:hypothetical protein [Clostridia bacterium]